MSASALAASRGWPVILTAQDEVPGAIAAYLEGLATPLSILPIGGEVAISDAVLQALAADGYDVVGGAAGPTRYATSHAVATRQLNNDPTTVWVATGADYPDALTAGAAAAATGGALHLTDPTTTHLDGDADLRALVTDNRACDGSGTLEQAKVAGGPAAIIDQVMQELAALLSCQPFPQGTLLRDLVADLPVATETRDGYDRDLFNHRIDADGDCQDTRAEVLAAESRVATSGCTISSGEWYSYYDGATWTQASDVDIDHLVPLAEAWDSGTRTWDTDTRERFAKDLDDGRSLVAVTDNVNQSTSDRDPTEWLPDREQCRYVEEWTVVKTRWSLTVDQVEKDVPAQWASNFPDVYIEVDKAPVTQDPEPNCHPAYPDFCVPPPPPDKELQRLHADQLHCGPHPRGPARA